MTNCKICGSTSTQIQQVKENDKTRDSLCCLNCGMIDVDICMDEKK